MNQIEHEDFETKLVLGQRYVALADLDSMYEGMRSATVAGFASSGNASAAEIAEFREGLDRHWAKNNLVEKLKAMTAKVMAQGLTVQELTLLVEFTSRPEMKVIQTKLPAIMKKSEQEMTRILQQNDE